jgi:hypothetical protein
MDAAPEIVKKLAGTPIRVCPAFGVSWIVAVYLVAALKAECDSDQVTVPV